MLYLWVVRYPMVTLRYFSTFFSALLRYCDWCVVTGKDYENKRCYNFKSSDDLKVSTANYSTFIFAENWYVFAHSYYADRILCARSCDFCYVLICNGYSVIVMEKLKIKTLRHLTVYTGVHLVRPYKIDIYLFSQPRYRKTLFTNLLYYFFSTNQKLGV